MPLVPIELPPGLYRNSTRYKGRNRWQDANLMRFRNGTPRPIGGWKRAVMDLDGVRVITLPGVCRAMNTWRANDQQRWVGLGTTRKLIAFDGGDFTDITPSGFVAGSDDVAVGAGYGAGVYGDDLYGTPRTVASVVSEAGRWTLDTWGETLVAVANSDGRAVEWTFTGLATPITNAPTHNRSLIVTNERHLMLLGAGDGPIGGGPGVYTPNPRHVWWCSQEDYTDWDRASAVNSAGDFNLDTPGQIMLGTRFAGDVFIFTDQDVHRCIYQGPPYIYGFHKLAEGCGVIGPGAVAVSAMQIAWMGQNGFFTYDGYVKPLECEVLDYVLADLNPLQAAKVYAGHNAAFNEFWWWYPSRTSIECDSYVIWNYVENHWTTGRMARTAWTDANVWPYPLAAEAVTDAGVTFTRIYQHEQGWLDDTVSRSVYLESGPLEIGNGDRRAFVDRVYQDVEPPLLDDVSDGTREVTPQPAFELTFKLRDAPNAPEQTYGPFVIDTERGYTDVRFDARQFTMRVTQTIDGDWQFGAFRLNFKQSSGR